MPGRAQSAAYAVAAMTLSRASWRTIGWPTTRRPSRVATASVMRADVRLDGVDDLGVSRAAAEIALQRGANGLAIRTRLACEEGERREQHARRAEAALHRAVADERLLQRMQAAIALQPAQRQHGAATQASGEHEAG